MGPWALIQGNTVSDTHILRAIAYATYRTKLLAPVVHKVDNTIHWTKHYPLDSTIGSIILI